MDCVVCGDEFPLAEWAAVFLDDGGDGARCPGCGAVTEVETVDA